MTQTGVMDAGMEPAMDSGLSGEITIGYIFPLTGELASHGEENMEAAKMGVADFNEYLERQGEQWSLRLIGEDSATNPVIALDKLTSLNARGVDVIIGPETSSNIRNMRAYSDSNNMMMVSCCSTAPALAIEGDSVFRFTTNDENQGVVLAKLAQKSGIEVIVPIYRGDAWGDGLVAAVRDSFDGTVDEGIRYNPEIAEYSASTSILGERVGERIAELGAGKVAVLLTSFAEGVQILQSASGHPQLSQVQWYGSDGNSQDQQITGDPIAGRFADSVSFSAPLIAVADNEINADVSKRLSDLLGRVPITYAYGSYDAAWVIGNAIMEAQSGSAADIKPIFIDVANEYSGALGDIRLNEAGDLAVADYEVWTVSDGQWSKTESYSYATGDFRPKTSALSGEITIGSILPLTGELASHGEENMEATKLGVADFNEYLERQGEQWRLKLVSEDSATNPVTALEKLTSLNARGIDVVIGPETSSNIRNMRAYSDANDMMLISCCSTAPALAIEGDSVFRFTTNDENQGVVLAKLAQGDGIGTLVPIYRGDAWGDGLVAAIKDNFAGTVDEGIRYNPELPEFSASASLLADRVSSMDSGTAAVLLISFSEGAQIIQSAAQYDSLKQVQWYGSDGNAKDQKISTDPIARSFAEAVSFSAPIIAVDDNQINQGLRDRLTEMLGREPITYTYGSYDAAWVVGKAVMEAQSGSASDIKPIFADIANAHSGALGDIQLNAAGDLAVADYEVWTAKDGSWESTAKYSYATGKLSGTSALEGEISIGSILPLTGELASHGEENMEATKLGVADFNEYLERQGEQWRLKLVSEDSATNPVTALEKLTSLNARGIDVVIGPETSSNIRNMRAYSDANDMMLISCCSTAPALAIEGDSVFRFTTNDENQGVVLAKLAQRDGIETLVPIYRGDAWGDGLVAAIKDSFDGTVDEGIRYNPELPEFSASVSLLADRVSSMDSGTAAVLLISFSEGAQIIQSAAQYDSLKEVGWYGSDGNAKDQKISTDPIASEFAISVSFSAPIIAVDDNEINQGLRDRLTEMLGREPITYTYGSYDAAWVVGKAVMEAQSGSASEIKPIFMDIANAHSGALGNIQLNAAGDLAVADYQVWTATADGWEPTAKYSYRTNQLN